MSASGVDRHTRASVFGTARLRRLNNAWAYPGRARLPRVAVTNRPAFAKAKAMRILQHPRNRKHLEGYL